MIHFSQMVKSFHLWKELCFNLYIKNILLFIWKSVFITDLPKEKVLMFLYLCVSMTVCLNIIKFVRSLNVFKNKNYNSIVLRAQVSSHDCVTWCLLHLHGHLLFCNYLKKIISSAITVRHLTKRPSYMILTQMRRV